MKNLHVILLLFVVGLDSCMIGMERKPEAPSLPAKGSAASHDSQKEISNMHVFRAFMQIKSGRPLPSISRNYRLRVALTEKNESQTRRIEKNVWSNFLLASDDHKGDGIIHAFNEVRAESVDDQLPRSLRTSRHYKFLQTAYTPEVARSYDGANFLYAYGVEEMGDIGNKHYDRSLFFASGALTGLPKVKEIEIKSELTEQGDAASTHFLFRAKHVCDCNCTGKTCCRCYCVKTVTQSGNACSARACYPLYLGLPCLRQPCCKG